MDARVFSDNDEGLDMARRTQKELTNSSRVEALIGKLRHAGTDAGAFARVRQEIENDPQLAVDELAAIAVIYRGGGAKPASRAAALRAIEKRQLELVRNKAQIAQAKKARPW